MAPSVAVLKIHAVWCCRTSQVSGKGGRGWGRTRGDGHIDRYKLRRLSLKQGKERISEAREKKYTREERGEDAAKWDIDIVAEKHELHS